MIDDSLLGYGPKVQEFEEAFASYSGYKYNVAVNSGSSAAFIIFAYLKEHYGSLLVHTPSWGFVSPVWAAKHHKHSVVFSDVDDNLLMNASRSNSVLMPVLYGGASDIPGFARWSDSFVVVDSCHCLTPKLKGDFAFFSGNPFKPLKMSMGGVISTDSPRAVEWMRNYRNFGREAVGYSYDIVQDGSKFYMDGINAQLGLQSLDQWKMRRAIRKRIINRYINEVVGDFIHHGADSSYSLSTLITEHRDTILNQLRDEGIPASIHYPPLHLTFAHWMPGVNLPNTERLAKQVVNLPVDINQEEQSRVIDIVNAIIGQ